MLQSSFQILPLFFTPFQEVSGIGVDLKLVFFTVVDNIAFIDILAIVKIQFHLYICVCCPRHSLKSCCSGVCFADSYICIAVLSGLALIILCLGILCTLSALIILTSIALGSILTSTLIFPCCIICCIV